MKRFGSTVALDGVDVAIGEGVTGLLGANGAGKTTLLTLILGLRKRDAGLLDVLGADPGTAGPEVRQRLGFAPEHHQLPGDMTAADLVAHIARLHGLPKVAATQRASDTLWEVGLGEERFRPIGTMSTGQRQRVKLAQAVAHHPELVILDEPTDGLDPMQRTDMLALISRLATEHGINVLISSHHLEEVERVCDGVVMLASGRVARAGRISDLTVGGAGLVVEVYERAAELADALTAAGLKARAEGDETVRLAGTEAHPAGAAADAVRDAVADLHLRLRSLLPEHRSLSEVFGAAQAGDDDGAGTP
ncbi:MAG: ABC transporter ATP-binding protein [Acidimicrobiia bacterium]|nr:ABC transporter ATP-binding protein [Acidimicrobiia bacterium]MYE67139.1 ABC transporter ATP-binding protein [Acidimicrobiia bacterium]